MAIGLGHIFEGRGVVFIAFFIDFDIGLIIIGFHTALTPLVTVGIVLIELSSIIENIGKINPELAQAKFMKIFTDYNSKDEDNGDTNTTGGR